MDGLGAVGASEVAEAREKEFQVVGDFGDGTDGAAGGADWVGLAEGDGGWDTFDAVDSGAIHTLEKLACVGAESFRVAALAFSVKSIESEGGFA